MPSSDKVRWRAPDTRHFAEAVKALESLHGKVKTGVYPRWKGHQERKTCGHVPTVVESLVRTILSQNTTNKNASRAFDGLMTAFNSDFEQARQQGAQAIARSIVVGGLANVKGKRIAAMMDDVVSKQGTLSLEHLRDLSDADAKEQLMQYEGVGPKTASCVLLFCLGRHSFAVDTHVHRIALRMGWVPPKSSREKAHDILDAHVPDALKYRLHVLLVRHGKSCPECAARQRPQRAPEGPCPLVPRGHAVDKRGKMGV